MTVEQFANYWLREFPRKSNSTNKRYESGIKGFVRNFGSRDIASISRSDAFKWASKNSRSNVRVVQNLFADAYNSGYVKTNVFANLRLPASRGRKDIEVPTVDDLALLQSISRQVHAEPYGSHFANLIQFAAYSGLRLSELLALEGDHVDRLNDEINVVGHLDDLNALQPGGKGGIFRTVVLLPEAKACMPDTHGLLFKNKRGTRLSKANHFLLWKPVRDQLDAALHFHSLRHFTATYLLSKGASYEIVAVQMGHIDAGGRPNTTLIQSLYGHPRLAHERAALKEIVNGTTN